MRGFEQIPWLYDAALAVLERGGLRRWREWLVRGASGRTLDLGTGTGHDLPLLPEEAGFEVDEGSRRARGVMRRLAARSPGGPDALSRARNCR